MIKSETNWLDAPCKCGSCGDTYLLGYLITTAEGDNICEDCIAIIELAELLEDYGQSLKTLESDAKETKLDIA